MPPGPPIGEREREILTAIVETFIATGDPVGSRTLARSNHSAFEAGVGFCACSGSVTGTVSAMAIVTATIRCIQLVINFLSEII